MKSSILKSITIIMSLALFAYQPVLNATELSTITISGKDGSKTNGESWNSSKLQGKVTAIFYIDPDKKNINKKMQEGLKALQLDRKYFQSVAIIDLASTWIPNSMINKVISKKQKKYPHTTYILDKKNFFNKNWGLPKDSYYVMVTNPEKKVVYAFQGKLDDKESNKLYYKLKEEIKKLEKKSLDIKVPKATKNKIHLQPTPKQVEQ